MADGPRSADAPNAPNVPELGGGENLTRERGVPSTVPTARPSAGSDAARLGGGAASAALKPSLFAGLLAEAGAPNKPGGPRGGGSVAILSEPPKQEPRAVPEGRMLGQYRVLGEIGSGGMAVVYKALQPALDRLVALKELRHELLADRQIVARFEREATSLATLQHGNIVHIYDFIRDAEGAYIVMEFVEGLDLFDLLHTAGRLPPEIAGSVALQLAEGLEYAHYRGIIHRDVKPSNLLISKMGEVKIMDFGIARDPGRSELTQVGMALGTPAYMAPEQIRGDKTDFRADHFAAGIVLYEMLSGQKPWGDGEGTTIARRILYEAPTPLTSLVPDVPPPLARIVERCLERDPEKRFASTHELRRVLAAYLAQELSIDVRQRLVIFLRNRGLITDGEASSFAHTAALFDGVLRRRDLGLPSEPARVWIRPIIAAGAVGLALAVSLSAWMSVRLGATPGPLRGMRPDLELRR